MHIASLALGISLGFLVQTSSGQMSQDSAPGAKADVDTAALAKDFATVDNDGSFNYDPVPAVFGAAQEHNLPFLTVMFNNHGYLSQKSGIPRYYPSGWAVQTNNFSGLHIVPAPNYATIAKAFEGYGETVEEPAEVRKAVERGLRAVAGGQLALIDVRLKPVAEIKDRGEG